MPGAVGELVLPEKQAAWSGELFMGIFAFDSRDKASKALPRSRRVVTGLCGIPVTGNQLDFGNVSGLLVSVYLNKVRVFIKNTLSEGEVAILRFELALFDKFFFC